jgi:two-component system, NtrC family, sensor histidine kinase PilS
MWLHGVGDMVQVSPATATQQEELDHTLLAFRRKLQGLLLFRLVLATFSLLLTIVVQSRRGSDLMSAHLQPLYFFSASLFLFTIVASLVLDRLRNMKRFAYGQIFFDVLAVTMLVFLSGGVDSIYSVLYMPVIISGAVLLLRTGSFWAAALCSLCYGLLLDLQFLEWIKPLQMVEESVRLGDSARYFHTLAMNIAAFFVVAYVSGHMAEELEKSSHRVREQKRDLDRLEMLHHNIVQSMNSGLLSIDLQGTVQYCNRHAQEILELAENQIVGRPIDEFFHDLEETLPLLKDPEACLARQLTLQRRECGYQTPSAKKLHLGYTVSGLQDERGQCLGWIANFQNLTSLKEMESQVQRMERLALAGKVASEIAHEIKNPLAAMSGSMQMLQDGVQHDPWLAKLTEIFCREIDRINSLVTSFLWLAKTHPVSGRIQEVAVCSAIVDTIRLMKDHHEMSSRYRVQTMFLADPVLQLDPYTFQQILWNLLKNALEAMPEGGDLMVRVGLKSADQTTIPASDSRYVFIDIQDSGMGIPADIQEKIFEPFFTTKEQGTGLGLSTVYQLLQSSGGRIEVRSEPDRGSTFSLLFLLA